ncbi:sensor histidine kinase [Streptomyces griseoluteus]|uniref:hypothetical protein n=1 Tax=Streptomyces griseoluteus TaxID=29306 RepID=UPI003655DC44
MPSPPLAVAGGRSDETPVRRGPWTERGRSAWLVLSSFAGGLALLFLVLEQRPGGGWRVLDIAVGALASLVLLVRYRAPLVVGPVLAVAGAFSATAGVANYVALFAVARSRPTEQAFLVALADIAGALVFWLLYPANSALSLTVVVNTAITLAVVAWGALRQKQQDLVAVYRDRAARIEREREQRAEQIQMAERARIARDMHDSVAHPHLADRALRRRARGRRGRRRERRHHSRDDSHDRDQRTRRTAHGDRHPARRHRRDTARPRARAHRRRIDRRSQTGRSAGRRAP